MVHQDHWALGRWYQHYKTRLGAENLYIVSHGSDPALAALCPGASILTIPRGELKGFDRWRGRMLDGFMAGLLEIYDWVIRTDADELICLDPEVWPSFQALFAAAPVPAVFALGLNLYDMHQEAEPRDAVFSGHYSKVWAFQRPLAMKRHGVGMAPRRLAEFPYTVPDGVLLAHLKYANRPALTASYEVRRSVATQEGAGQAWLSPSREAEKQFAKVTALPMVPWEVALTDARETLLVPVRDQERSILRSKNTRATMRTELAEWCMDAIWR